MIVEEIGMEDLENMVRNRGYMHLIVPLKENPYIVLGAYKYLIIGVKKGILVDYWTQLL